MIVPTCLFFGGVFFFFCVCVPVSCTVFLVWCLLFVVVCNLLLFVVARCGLPVFAGVRCLSSAIACL